MTGLEAERSTDPAWLLGRWSFDRAIDDRRNGIQGRVTGEMIFVAEPDRIRWQETGTLTWGETRTPVTRTLYLVEQAGDRIVTFADGRHFHDWRPGVAVRHPCGDDHYAGVIDIAPGDPELLIITWDVTGPGKDYTAVTRMTRSAP
ncbi:DUF6314 family protein [Microlunatus speluncae]|uniref:DUF6314 family protein n=1 Tax=Microlunatus speluncae TaxID=2594267 RepID=UPI001266604C|nr:DUF6314 family protein [Microlunatus speluncae]